MSVVPSEIRLSDARRRLEVFWEDGSISQVGAETLRANSRSADAVRADLDDRSPAVAADLSIEEVNPIGAYAVNLVFSDGHRRGIYPWTYLRALADAAPARA